MCSQITNGAKPLPAIWLEEPIGRTGLEIEILPADFDTKKSPCVMCAGTLDFDWTCTRCCADHFPAVKRLIRSRKNESR